ncbi:MAG TPA: hypothetical protein VF516_36955 [Kofleriaceae bacterium]
MGSRHVLLALAGLLAAGALVGGCGKEIGDACTLASDCSPNGDRICQCSNCSGTDPTGDSAKGYCTIQGCDFGTCPGEAVCVRFFTGSFDNKPCTPQTADTDCSIDELCSLAGNCVPRSAEVRYCMLKCDSGGDCRDNFECRDKTLMMEHGGEPVPQQGTTLNADNPPKFCAAKP